MLAHGREHALRAPGEDNASPSKSDDVLLGAGPREPRLARLGGPGRCRPRAPADWTWVSRRHGICPTFEAQSLGFRTRCLRFARSLPPQQVADRARLASGWWPTFAGCQGCRKPTLGRALSATDSLGRALTATDSLAPPTLSRARLELTSPIGAEARCAPSKMG